MPRFRTDVDELTKSDPILRADVGSWWRRRAVAHQSTDPSQMNFFFALFGPPV